jgi:hypothetical protein
MFGSRLIFGSHFPFRVAQLRDARERREIKPVVFARIAASCEALKPFLSVCLSRWPGISLNGRAEPPKKFFERKANTARACLGSFVGRPINLIE